MSRADKLAAHCIIQSRAGEETQADHGNREADKDKQCKDPNGNDGHEDQRKHGWKTASALDLEMNAAWVHAKIKR